MKTITLVFLPSLVDERQRDLLVKRPGQECIVWSSHDYEKKKAEMSPFPQSIPIQVGPGAHFVSLPTCKEGSRERESHLPSPLFVIVQTHPPSRSEYHCRRLTQQFLKLVKHFVGCVNQSYDNHYQVVTACSPVHCIDLHY